MSCGFFYDGVLWVQATEVHVWDGVGWVQAIEVHAYENAAWRRIFPCEVITLLEETFFILDTGSVIKISRDVLKGPFVELLELTESTLTAKRQTVSETMNILDTGQAIKISRDVIKGPHRELLLLTETGAISITDLPPVVSNCTIEDVEVDNKARVVFDPDDFCESVRVDKIVDSTHSFHENIDTTPNTTGVASSYYNGTCGETVEFEVHPFKADGQSGLEGTKCNTEEVILGPEICP